MLYYLYVFIAAVLSAQAVAAIVFFASRRSERSALWIAGCGVCAAVYALLLVLYPPEARSALLTQLQATVLCATLFCLNGTMLGGFGAKPAPRLVIAALAIALLAQVAIWGGFALKLSPLVPLASVAAMAALLLATSTRRLLQPGANGSIILVAALMAGAAVAAGWDQLQTALNPPWTLARVTPFALLFLLSTLSYLTLRSFMNRLLEQERLAQQLGERIEKTKANLLASESARRSLEVSSAITHERERMMREIHDGIGSSLMAAIASAERQGRQTSTAIVALKSALTDLRIAVDSLEPVEGNVATLLASLRYRLEPDMKRLGISINWRVADVPELDWLDSSNALHVLRIFQEAIGNILGHANATMIRFECKLDLNEGRPGIRIEVEDNGVGFDPSIPSQGKGRRNIAERAEALEGKLWIDSAPGKGTKTSLWLPLLRSGATRSTAP